MWQAVSHGAREIANYAWYPMSSGFESNGYGLINLDGTLTARAKAAGRVAALIGRHAQLINSAEPAPAEVAVLYDRLSYMVGGSQPSPSTLGNAERDSLLGVYRAFFENQIPVDFVHPAALDRDHLRQYKILFLPYPVMLPEGVANAVKEYVKQGGTVVAEARLAWNDARGYASPVVPGFGLDALFAARETLIRPETEPKMLISAGANLPGLASGQTVPGAAFEEHLEVLEGGRALATFSSGDAAIVQRSYGQGKALLVGSFIGLAYQRAHNAATRSLMLSLAESAGVKPEVEVSGAGTADVEVRRLVSHDQQLVFVFNHANVAADAAIALHLAWKARTAHDLVAGSDVPFEGNVFHKRLAPGEIWVVELERE